MLIAIYVFHMQYLAWSFTNIQSHIHNKVFSYNNGIIDGDLKQFRIH